MTIDEAVAVASWRYSGDWSVYDLSTPQPIIDHLVSYRSVASGDEVVGFYCTGVEARVADMAEDPAILDVGMGMHPELVGRGNGTHFGEVVLRDLQAHHPGVTLRVVVQSWNGRSLALTHRLGFQPVGKRVVVQDGRKVTYDVLHLPPTPGRT
jgi:[ribosomal protein S18]-alanine N-acetyltransferase